MYEVYRVLKSFRWRGWHYGPRHTTGAVNPQTGKFDTCDCGEYAGDIWIVEAGHPRKDAMIAARQVTGDASLPPVDELLKEARFKRLLSEPSLEPERELVGARRSPGRPAAPK